MKKPCILFVSDKRLYRYEGQHFTDGQTPFQLRAFSETFDLHVLSPTVLTQRAPRALSKIEGDITFHSLGRVKYFLSIPQPWVERIVRRRTAQCIQDIRPDAVVAKFPREIGLYGVVSAADRGIPTLLNYDYDWFSDVIVRVDGYPTLLVGWYKNWILRYRASLTRLGCEKATLVTTVSRAFASSLKRMCGKEVCILTNTYSLSDVFFAVPPPESDARYHALFVGRVDRNKNLDALLQAFCQARRTIPRLRLTIVGDGPRLPHVRRLAKSLDMEKAVTLCGYVRNRDLPGIIARAGVLVLPSFSESLGQVLLEAMAAGRAVIGSRTGGIPELIHDGENGILIDPHDTDSLSSALCRIAHDWDVAVHMGEVGRQIARQYTPTATNQRWVDTISTLLAQTCQ